jgi:MOSC domain-containing protein YiiM
MATLDRIWIKRGKRAPMNPVDEATLETDVGIRGNADVGGRRQVTLIDGVRWDEVRELLGADVEPILGRANLLVRGVDLEETRGRLLRVGEALIRIGGETVPCRLMDEQHPGLQEALRPRWRGGAYGTVETGGTIRVGDAVRWEEQSRE